MYEDIITIYNIVNDVGYKTVFRNVHFEVNTGVAVDDTGMKENDSALCIIPFESLKATNKTYVNWKEFAKMDEEQRKTHFTFKNNDKFVFGDINFEITNQKPYTISDLERNFLDVFTMTNFTFRKLSNSKVNHVEIVGK